MNKSTWRMIRALGLVIVLAGLFVFLPITRADAAKNGLWSKAKATYGNHLAP
jgi:uncharacterized membrane protein